MNPKHCTYDLEITSLHKMKSASSTQTAKQTLNIFGYPLDSLRDDGSVDGVTESLNSHNGLISTDAFTLRPLQSSQSFI